MVVVDFCGRLWLWWWWRCLLVMFVSLGFSLGGGGGGCNWKRAETPLKSVWLNTLAFTCSPTHTHIHTHAHTHTHTHSHTHTFSLQALASGRPLDLLTKWSLDQDISSFQNKSEIDKNVSWGSLSTRDWSKCEAIKTLGCSGRCKQTPSPVCTWSA